MKHILKNHANLLTMSIMVAAMALAFLACEEKGKKSEAGTFTDARDGKIYKTVKIGEQVWMADNLAFDDDDSCDADCKKSDKLYDWESAMKACPKGWRLPSDAEWKTLVALAGSDNIIKGTDKYGFNAYGGGACFGDGGCSGGAFWWTSTEEGDYQAKYRSLNNSMIGDSEGKYCAFSIRCIQGDGGTASKAASPATDTDYSPALQTHYSKGTLGESGKTRPIEMFFQKVSKNGDSYSISGKSKTNAAEDAFSGTLSISSQTAGGSCNSGETELKGSYDFNEKESKTSGHFVGTFIACEKSGTLSKASFKGNWVKHANGNKTPCEFELSHGSTFTDTRDGKTYKSVKIGSQTWMAENLNYKIGQSWCYDDDENNCKEYGRLYGWETAKTACPKDWHLPSVEEWDRLVEMAGGKEVAGKKFKSKTGWNDNGNGTDEFGFSALPGGCNDCMPGDGFAQAGEMGYWWEMQPAYKYDGLREMDYKSDGVSELLNAPNGYSVRCIKN